MHSARPDAKLLAALTPKLIAATAVIDTRRYLLAGAGSSHFIFFVPLLPQASGTCA